MSLTEDTLYASSTQFRLWSFTPEKLVSLRAETNAFATKNITKAIKRARASDETDNKEQKIDCLTMEEEQTLINAYCAQLMHLGQAKPFSLPVSVVGTAVQFFKRFYLSNSPMTYHPLQILPATLFLATKTESRHMALKDFAERLRGLTAWKTATPDEVIAPEFIITQALRFSFSVRHPYRALSGFRLEMLGLLEVVRARRGPAGFPLAVEDVRGKLLGGRDPEAWGEVVQRMHETALKYLHGAALLSDVYFLYAPAHITFAALHIADPEFTEMFLEIPLRNKPELKARVLATVLACKVVLLEAEKRRVDKEEVARVEAKLALCRDPEKIDLVGLNRAQKRDAAEDGQLDEKVAKKRRLIREKSARDAEDLFGPGLVGK
ncbi:cyclin-like protein [Trichodelitschia bisporula]|uniref:Cyclin-like protein n=1 Tax=Trichodelitschia bisporula TaxID=703511 RepID=A0A6G1I932_9PEZI|nr:cyclin-like protein [Trichodelitschia bisporula]